MKKKKNFNAKGILDTIDDYDGNPIEDKNDFSPSPFTEAELSKYQELISKMIIEIPYNKIKPVNQRIFCIEVDPHEQKTEGGIIIPTQFALSEAKGGRTRKLRRYFVVDLADDCTIPVKRGMEIYPFIPIEAEAWSFPEVYDWEAGKIYITLHQTEIHGISMAEVVEKD